MLAQIERVDPGINSIHHWLLGENVRSGLENTEACTNVASSFS